MLEVLLVLKTDSINYNFFVGITNIVGNINRKIYK